MLTPGVQTWPFGCYLQIDIDTSWCNLRL